jgi:HEAT repeat protein
LKDPSGKVRVAAATALASVLPAAALVSVRPSGIEALVSALTDDDWQVRRAVAGSFRTMADRSKLPRQVVEQVAAGAVEPLAKRMADELWDTRDPYHDDSGSKGAAWNALRELDPDRVTPALLNALKARGEDIRIWACEKLPLQKDKPSADGLIGALKDPSGKVRVAAATALASVLPPAVDALVSALTDDDWQVRRAVALTFRTMGDRSKLPRQVVEQVVAGAVDPLTKRVADELWDTRDSYHDDSGSKGAAWNALRELDPDRVTPALLNALKAKREDIRVWACKKLALQKDRASTDALTAALDDSSKKVQAAAMAALKARKQGPP